MSRRCSLMALPDTASKDLEAIKKVVLGNGDAIGLKTRTALMENNQKTMKEDIEDIKSELKKIQSNILWGFVAIIAVQIALDLILKFA